jgi:hypothetical protein
MGEFSAKRLVELPAFRALATVAAFDPTTAIDTGMSTRAAANFVATIARQPAHEIARCN